MSFCQVQFLMAPELLKPMILARVSVYLSVFLCVFRVVNETSTEASMAPGIDQLCSTNSWLGIHKV
jgi:hypothetical protein